jgi:hypothetical protein
MWPGSAQNNSEERKRRTVAQRKWGVSHKGIPFPCWVFVHRLISLAVKCIRKGRIKYFVEIEKKFLDFQWAVVVEIL